ncbi:MAG: phosphoribosylformylglycinamidine synthase subunit PurS [Phycisphaerae bacterium]|nr:phosphoribosylformylglycinamidine synthase subunit PurS [Phycisphaerae bacterium]
MNRTLWRFEVRPNPDHPDPAGQATLVALREFGLDGIDRVETARLYIVEMAADTANAERVARELLADPVSESFEIASDDAPFPSGDRAAIEIHYRPGVMDPAAASTRRAIADLGIPVESVRTARRYVFHPAPDGATLRWIGRLLGNDCIEEVVPGRKPLAALPKPIQRERDVRTVAIRGLSDDAMRRLSRDGHLFLSLDEMRAIEREFARLGRDPTDLELETLAQTWSEHCVHKTLKSAVVYRGAPFPSLDDDGASSIAETLIERRYENLLRDTIARATDDLIRRDIGPTCLSVFKDNAGIIAFDERDGIAFKVETHNHPSAIEPYGGAATGLGGCIRDVLGCGLGAKPIANTDVFCVAPPDWPADALPRGVLHPRRVLCGVVAGVRDYGNRMGIPTVNGAIHFDPRYLANPLVFCGCAGIIPRDRIEKAARPGDAIVLIGGRTGRDGIHGATFSSAELTGTHADEFSHAVQIGNAIEEKKLLDVILQARDWPAADGTRRCLYSAITDCGAGGLSSAVGEMGAAIGADVDLKRVPLKYEGLRYDEIWISEAQERMVLAVPEPDVETFHSLCRSEDVEATVIGRFTDSGRLVVRYDGRVVGDLDMQFLHEGLPRTTRAAEWRLRSADAPRPPPSTTTDFAGELLGRLADPSIASKEWVVRQYDHEVQGRSVVRPLNGRRDDGPSDAAVLRPRLGSDRGIAIGCGLCPSLSDVDPYWMAVAAIDEALRNVVCVGGDPSQTAILDNFCWGRTDAAEPLGALVRACQGCHDAAIALGAPFISGKDSLNNEFSVDPSEDPALVERLARLGLARDARQIAIPGTLLISAIAIVPDVAVCVTSAFKRRGNPIYLVGRPARLGAFGPEFAPPFQIKVALATHRAIARSIQGGEILAAHDVSDGGLWVAISEMCIGGDCGADIRLNAPAPLTRHGGFHAFPSLYVVEVRADRETDFLSRLGDVPRLALGRTAEADANARLMIRWEPSAAPLSIPVDALRSAWRSAMRG